MRASTAVAGWLWGRDEPTYAPGFGRIGYRRTAEGEVRYLPVESERGLLGYLWL
ncbi:MULTISPECIES: hypothetical protein [unclassified Streptomyces]|uniref:hypothetical protein n=1 Tax=unclassified Streptomyces TaxID=2593676 RepID=UPI000AD3D1EF|nr:MULTISPECIES: hypothetical protein [unclassified Streptomyces]